MKALELLICAALASAVGGCAGSGNANATQADDQAQFAGRAYAGDSQRGSLVFETNCATCHGAGGRSGGVGPSLIDEDERQDLGRTIVWIENPDPPMPRLYPSPLSEEDVADVAAYVQSIR